MPKPLRYTTFKPGELEQSLRKLAPQGVLTIPLTNGGRNGGQCKSHTFAVTFPDGQSGTCRYERKGPRWHEFHYTYADGAKLPRQVVMERLGGETPTEIEQKGTELANACYLEAIHFENCHYFRRASEPSDGSRKRRPERYSMKAQRAKESAGLYALCRQMEKRLLPMETLYSNLERANAAWREKGDIRLLVACCNRLDRCWELPKYNSLYAEFDPRPEFQKEKVHENP